MKKIRALEAKFDDTLTVLADQEQQRDFGIFVRAAADWAFVPSCRESFGLVAAEGLLFGASVISTGVGGLKEFLVDRPVDVSSGLALPHHNAYLFQAPNKRASAERAVSLGKAISDAVKVYEIMSQNETNLDTFRWNAIKSAVELDWNGFDEIPIDSTGEQKTGIIASSRSRNSIWRYNMVYGIVLNDVQNKVDW